MSIELIIYLWFQEFLTLLTIVAAPALTLYAANELWYRACGLYGYKTELITGCVGTPIHEISHAVAVKLFGMSIHDIALYQPDPQSRTLGYVVYAYQPGSVWHGLGRFVVGIAPLIGGALVVTGLLWLGDLPLFGDYRQASDPVVGPFWQWARDLLSSADNFWTWVFLALAVMVATHATPSGADLKGCASGLFGTIVMFMTLKLVLVLLPEDAYQAIRPYIDLEAFFTEVGAQVMQLAALGIVAALLLSLAALMVKLGGKVLARSGA
ncbi:hypothetical protein [Marinobacter sp. P4B1]|uniref:hypothetical protein n=1 Tax=Marinobacter sp. P4B1 TaxID=1119533 RepID=UPI00071E2BF3|nr:hypothetical protein [Marinobacter sp. P4B1]KRW83690.1 hypothetical protein AQ621_16710 [Marinobacter sp. P4B1]